MQSHAAGGQTAHAAAGAGLVQPQVEAAAPGSTQPALFSSQPNRQCCCKSDKQAAVFEAMADSRAQQGEVVVGVDVVEREDEVHQRLAAAAMMQGQAEQFYVHGRRTSRRGRGTPASCGCYEDAGASRASSQSASGACNHWVHDKTGQPCSCMQLMHIAPGAMLLAAAQPCASGIYRYRPLPNRRLLSRLPVPSWHPWPHLLCSWSGPTGDLEREEGEAEPATTSSSSDRLSFLSSPASLPAGGCWRGRWVHGRSGAGRGAGSRAVEEGTARGGAGEGQARVGVELPPRRPCSQE